jgi:predicted dinucleotide-binding enzyme
MRSNGEAICRSGPLFQPLVPSQEIPDEDPSRHRGNGSLAGAAFSNSEGGVQGDIATALEISRRSVMSYSIIGTGSVGSTLASFLAKAGIEVGLANTKGAEAVEPLAGKLGRSVVAKSLDDALKADVIFFAVQFLQFKDVASARSDWTGKIAIDVTNAFKLPPEVMEAELNGRLSSEVNAERVPGAKLVKAFNQLPMNVLSSPVPAGGRRVVFISSDDKDASAKVARLAEELGFAPIEVGKIGEGGRLIQVGNALVFQDLIKFEKR